MRNIKQIALVAHDNCKQNLIEWVEWNWKLLIQHKLICTGTTGSLVEKALQKKVTGSDFANVLNITKLKSGPLGGDQQLGALISDGEIDILIFLWDPMKPQPHDVDVKALLRIATLYNVVSASNRATADFIISSPLFDTTYEAEKADFEGYINRKLQ